MTYRLPNSRKSNFATELSCPRDGAPRPMKMGREFTRQPTPLGKKANEQLPQLAFIAGQMGLRQAQAHATELRQMLSTAR